MEAVDLSKNGNVDYHEFITAAMSKSKLLSKHNLELAFRNFDKVKKHLILC